MAGNQVFVDESLVRWIGDHPDARPIREVHAYWQSKRGDRPALPRCELDPLEIDARSLPYVYLVDVVDEGIRRFRYRLVGTRVTFAYEGEYTGRYMDELLTPGNYAWVSDVYSRVVDDIVPSIITGDYRTRDGESLQAARFVAPLAKADGAVDCVLGAFFPLEPAARRRPFGP